jgi:hypothetical protein
MWKPHQNIRTGPSPGSPDGCGSTGAGSVISNPSSWSASSTAGQLSTWLEALVGAMEFSVFGLMVVGMAIPFLVRVMVKGRRVGRTEPAR